MRTCKKCLASKTLDQFAPSGNGPGSLRWECRECQRERYKLYYLSNRPAYQAKAARSYLARRDDLLKCPAYRERRKNGYKRYAMTKRAKVLNHYGRICRCCGESNVRFLTIDHVHSDGHVQRKEHGSGLDFYRWIIKNNFPDDLQTLCFNCNIGRALNGGICPHKEGSTIIPDGGEGPSGPERATPTVG